MKKTYHYVIKFIISLLLSSSGFSQNITIDYQAWNPTSPPCNLFGTQTNVPLSGGGTIPHLTLIGQPIYNSNATSKYVQMDCIYNNATSILGTDYRITYNFKQNYSYIITITAAELISTTGNSTGPYLRIDVNNNAGTGNTTCNGAGSINQNFSGNPPATQLSNTTFSDYQFPISQLSSSLSSLEISAIPANNGASNSILIKKITIVETAPTPTFTISPTSVSIPCGTNTTQAFTVNNVYNSPGTLSYNWNLGTANNGWLYQGSAAPQTFTTTTNSISLTSSATATALSNVSVTVVLNGVNYTTLTSAVTLTTPA